MESLTSYAKKKKVKKISNLTCDAGMKSFEKKNIIVLRGLPKHTLDQLKHLKDVLR